MPTCRFYLVQDFEPPFYPGASEHVLAEDSYRVAGESMVATVEDEVYGPNQQTSQG